MAKRRQAQSTYSRVHARAGEEEMIKKGDLVRHVSDASFGLGIVTDVIKDSTMPSIKVAKV